MSKVPLWNEHSREQKELHIIKIRLYKWNLEGKLEDKTRNSSESRRNIDGKQRKKGLKGPFLWHLRKTEKKNKWAQKEWIKVIHQEKYSQLKDDFFIFQLVRTS